MAELKTWPVALQLYSLREDAAKDFLGTIAETGRMGYDGVEFAGYFGTPAKDVAKAVKDAGMRIAGSHVGLANLVDDALSATADYEQELGNPYVIVPALPEEYRGDRDRWLRTADLFNDITRKLKAWGLRAGYHSHGFDFAPVEGGDGETGWDIIGEHTDPSFILQLDVGNTLYADKNALAIFNRFPGRYGTIHFKECKDGKLDVPLGAGAVPWGDIFAGLRQTDNTDWAIIEVEVYWDTPAACAKEDVERLRDLWAQGR